MLDDRVLVSASAAAVGGELVITLTDDAGTTGTTIARNDAGLADRLVERLNARIGCSLVAEGRRWVDRPRHGGSDWVAFAAVENGLLALTIAAAGVSLRRWLGGTLRRPSLTTDSATLGVDGYAVGDASFDEVTAWLPGASVGFLSVDPRGWPIPALLRLDSLCRVLQVGIAIDVPEASQAGEVAEDLLAALPMATLGRRFDLQGRPAGQQTPVFSVGRVTG